MTVLEDANIDRSMPGVTGIRRFDVSLPPIDDGGDIACGLTVEGADGLVGLLVEDDMAELNPP